MEEPGLFVEKGDAERSRSDRVAGYAFPYNLISLAMMLSLVVIAATTWFLRQEAKELADVRAEQRLAMALHGDILRYDEVLTMSAWMAATTGHARWYTRYAEHEPQLEAALESLLILAPDGAHFVEATRVANEQLVEREHRAIEAAKAGDLDAAAGFLEEGQYYELKDEYHRSMHAFGQALSAFTEARVEAQASTLRRVEILSLLLAMFMGATWLYVLRTLMTWRRAVMTGYRALRESESKLKRALEVAELGTFSIDSATGLVQASPRAQELFGRVGQTSTLVDLLSKVDAQQGAEFEEALGRCLKAALGDNSFRELLVHTAPAPRHLRVSWGREEGDEGVALSGVVRDITAERFVEDRLRDDNQRLTNEVDRQATLAAERGRKVERLTHELLGAEQHERARIRRLIHDDLQQILVSSRMQAALLRDAAASLDSEPLSRIVHQIDEALECTRDLTLRLATASYEDQGLWAALVELCEQMKRRYGLQVALTASGELPGMRSEVMQLIYCALRELLFNVVKHAGVDKARVHLTFDAGQQLQVVVEDDGVGFEAAMLSWQQRGSGLGLGGMRTRFATIDGTLSVVSSPGGGCRIEVYIPDAAMRDTLSG